MQAIPYKVESDMSQNIPPPMCGYMIGETSHQLNNSHSRWQILTVHVQIRMQLLFLLGQDVNQK